jgi:hypothetical protein
VLTFILRNPVYSTLYFINLHLIKL